MIITVDDRLKPLLVHFVACITDGQIKSPFYLKLNLPMRGYHSMRVTYLSAQICIYKKTIPKKVDFI
jgi:hypothetical protein